MPFITLCLMNIVIGATAFMLTFNALNVRGFADGCLTWFVLSCCQVVASQLVLGIAGMLTLGNVYLLNAVVAVSVYLITRGRRSSFSVTGIRSFCEQSLNDRLVRLCAAAIIGFGCVKLAVNCINPPFGWDSLNYHFTFAVEWLKHGNLEVPITVFDDPSPSYYPINGSLVFLWLMWPLKSVFLADMGQVPFYAAAFVALFSLGRKLMHDDRSALVAACLFTLIPNYFKQLSVAYVDVMVAAFFLIALTFIFSVRERPSVAAVLCAGCATGLMVGTKTPALLYAVLLAVAFVFCIAGGARKALFLSLFGACVVAFGGFSYLRNALQTGNPFYPMELAIGGKALFRGVMEQSLYRVHFLPSDYRLDKLLFHEGLGAQTVLFVLPGMLLAAPALWLRERSRGRVLRTYVLLLPLLLYCVWRYVIPLANVRYLYHLLALGVLCGWYAFARFGLPRRAIEAMALLAVLASVPELAKKRELVAGLLVTAAMVPVVPLLVRKPRIALYAGSLLLLSFFWLEGDYTKNEYARYGKMVQYSGFWPDATSAWQWLNTVTTGNRIAYTGRPVPFPLYGTYFKNDVAYVSVNECDPVTLHSFTGSRYRWGHDFESMHRSFSEEGNYRAGASYEAWRQNLRMRATEYLFVYSLHQTKTVGFPVEEEWAKAHPESFVPVFRNDTIRIYRIIR